MTETAIYLDYAASAPVRPEAREAMLRALPPAAVSSPAPIVVIVFANDRSFGPFKPRFQGRAVAVDGFFQSGQDTNYIAINGDLREKASRVVFHEYSHFLVRSTLGVAPPRFSRSVSVPGRWTIQMWSCEST